MSNASARRMQSLLHAPIATLLWRRIALLPFTRKITKIQHVNGGTWMPQTSGDHLRNELLKRRHEQAEVAMQFDCCIDNLNRWEQNKAEPTARIASKIIVYLGSNPLPKTTFGQRLKAARLEAGLFQRELAEPLRVRQNAPGQTLEGSAKLCVLTESPPSTCSVKLTRKLDCMCAK